MSTVVQERRYRERSLWLDGLDEPLAPRPPLPGDVDVDVAVVGAGFTGLWTAYYLKLLQPDLRVAVVEREIAGFGPSGRNGGWVSAGVAGSAKVYSREAGRDAVVRAERETHRSVEEIGRVADAEGIDCRFQHAGALFVATSSPQRQRLDERVRTAREWGLGEDDLRLLEPHEVSQRVSIDGCQAATYSPHAARIDPARLVRGLASACERLGVAIYERTEALSIGPGSVRS